MGTDTRRRGVLALCVVLLLATGVAGGMWLQSARAANDGGVRLSAADIGFSQDMSTHHEQALLIAQSLAKDVDPQVRVLAEQIITAQTSEIATMHGWLSLFDEPFSTSHQMQWMHSAEHHAAGDGAPMPGMASMDEVTKLATLHAVEAEVLFLQLMIRHHQGGVEMATAAQELVSADPIRRSALGMVREQSQEIAIMTALLKARNANVLPYP